MSRKPFRRLESLMGPVASNAELLFGRTLPAGLAERLVSGLRFARRAYIDWQTRSHLVSYPKCGRTWLRVMLSRAVLDAAGLPTQGTDLTKVQRLHRLVEGSPRVAVTQDDDPHRKTPDELRTDKSAYRRRRVVLLVRVAQAPDAVFVYVYRTITRAARGERRCSRVRPLRVQRGDPACACAMRRGSPCGARQGAFVGPAI